MPLGKTAPKAGDQIKTLGGISAENEADSETVYGNLVFLKACPLQPFGKGGKHFPVRKTDAGFHGQIGRF